MQVYAEDWSGALTTLTDVYENGPYALEESFHYVFDVAHNNGPETVLAFQASVNDGAPGGENGNAADRLNFPHSGSPFGCCGFHQPSQNLVNAFRVDATGLPLLDGSWNDSELDPAETVDPRLDWTVGRDNVPFLTGGFTPPAGSGDRAWAGPFSTKKTVYEQSAGAASSVGWAPYQLNSLNRHLLRYADVMLFLAEAEIHAGSLENARTIINEIRARAASSAQGPDGGSVVVPMDDASITWATYDVGQYPPAGWDADMAMKALKMERRLELGLEGHRLFDLRRWGDAVTVINDYLEVEKTRRNYLNAAFEYQALTQLVSAADRADRTQ
ncbi:MAG: RagB/SusD family nutrient uptake outer membrane protein [Bacteroidales bacterium]